MSYYKSYMENLVIKNKKKSKCPIGLDIHVHLKS